MRQDGDISARYNYLLQRSDSDTPNQIALLKGQSKRALVGWYFRVHTHIACMARAVTFLTLDLNPEHCQTIIPIILSIVLDRRSQVSCAMMVRSRKGCRSIVNLLCALDGIVSASIQTEA
jgi:hypothetical protein